MSQKTTFVATGFICLLIILAVVFMYRETNEDFREEYSMEAISERTIDPRDTLEDEFVVPEEIEVSDDPIVLEEVEYEEAEDEETGETSYEEIIQTQKVTAHHNAALEYGFLIPYTHWYQGFGGQEGAIHTVGIHPDSEFETLADTQVRVYNYGGDRLPELTGRTFYQDAGRTYLWVADKYSIVIDAPDYEDPVLNMIIETVYYGPKEVEEPITDNQ